MTPINDAVVQAIKGYADSPIGLVAVLSENIGGLVYVAKFVRADTLTPVSDDGPFEPWENWSPAKPFPEMKDD